MDRLFKKTFLRLLYNLRQLIDTILFQADRHTKETQYFYLPYVQEKSCHRSHCDSPVIQHRHYANKHPALYTTLFFEAKAATNKLRLLKEQHQQNKQSTCTTARFSGLGRNTARSVSSSSPPNFCLNIVFCLMERVFSVKFLQQYFAFLLFCHILALCLAHSYISKRKHRRILWT